MNYSNVYSLFQTAVSNKLKYPKIRLQTADGQVVVLKLAGSQSKYCGQLQLTDDKPFGSNAYFGRISQDGTFQPSRDSNPAIVALLGRLAENPAEVASEYGKLTGNCCFCGLPLTDPQSTAVGYGPICAEHYGLPHGPAKHVRHPEAFIPANDPMLEALEQVDTPAAFTGKTVESVLADHSTPNWAIDVIKVALDKDAVDAASTLRVLAEAFDNRAKSLLGGSR